MITPTTRLTWRFLMINVWLIFLGSVMGWITSGFPWGVLVAAVGVTLVGWWKIRRAEIRENTGQ